jgi:hypothetical protein
MGHRESSFSATNARSSPHRPPSARVCVRRAAASFKSAYRKFGCCGDRKTFFGLHKRTFVQRFDEQTQTQHFELQKGIAIGFLKAIGFRNKPKRTIFYFWCGDPRRGAFSVASVLCGPIGAPTCCEAGGFSRPVRVRSTMAGALRGNPRCDGSGRVGRFFSPAHSGARKKPLPLDPAFDS